MQFPPSQLYYTAPMGAELGRIETRSLQGVGGSGSEGAVSAITVTAPDMRPEIVPDTYFRSAATEVVTTNCDGDKTHFLCVAPTGTGKTIYFTKNLMEVMADGSRVILLQPTVSAVIGAFNRLVDILEVDKDKSIIYKIKYLIGQRNETSSKEKGSGTKFLMLMTYGRALLELNSIERSYDYVLLDEIHNLNDPTVLACDLKLTKPGAKYKCVHLSATVGVSGMGHRLASHMNIEDTRFKIDETVKIQPAIGDKAADFLEIPNTIMGVKIDGFSKGYRIPLKPIEKGRVLFFVSSKRDCEKLVQHFIRTCAAGRQYIVVHSGTTIDLQSLPDNAWLVCTDIVGQSITIPGCRAVVDFLQEIKPTTRLYYNDSGIVYRSALERRRIDLFASKQRKGRTGRTNAGWYITPLNILPVVENGIDPRTAAESLLRLRATVGYSYYDIKGYYRSDVLEMIKNLEWILPDKLGEIPVWNKALTTVGGKDNKKISANLHDKLVLVHGVNEQRFEPYGGSSQ